MRWGLNKERHKEWSTRIRKDFAWLPTKLEDGSWLWLESYWTTVHYWRGGWHCNGASDRAYDYASAEVIQKERAKIYL